MLTLPEFQGAIFDVDDTLLDNKNRPGDFTGGLHARSRLAAVYEVGYRHDLPELLSITNEQNIKAFLDSPVHTLEGGVWQILLMTGLAKGELDHDNALLREIATLKDELHGDILLAEGEVVPGADDFVRSLAAHGLERHLAIASTAVRRDIDILLAKAELVDYFPESHITSKEKFTYPKPHPEAFDKAFASLGLPETARPYVAAFEDDPRGIISAKTAGLYTCAIGTRYTKKELLALPLPPDIAADSYAELAEQLEVPMPVI